MSQTTNPITLKIHHGDEIRRFSIDQLEWNQVVELVQSNYSTPFTLKYDDIENDRVTIMNQSDLDDALICAQNYIVHLYLVDKLPVATPIIAPTPATTPAPAPTPSTSTSTSTVDIKSDDLSSQLSSDEMKTILTECLSDPAIITTLPAFLITFIDTLINNMQSTTPMQTSWNTALQAHPSIRDHVILSVLLPRVQQTLNKADISGIATRVPVQTLQMIKGFIPMLPMFLPSLIPKLTQIISSDTESSSDGITNPLAHLMSQTQANNNPNTSNPMANNPLLSMLGPMFQQLQQSPLATMMNTGATNTTTPSTSTSTSTSPDYSSQLSTLSDLGVGSPELNLSLLKQWNGDMDKVLEFLSAME